jgi:site-specific recombinase XerC
MTVTPLRRRGRKPLDAGPLAPEIRSFRLHLAAEAKAPKTVRTYTEAVAWFAASHLLPCTGATRWDQVSSQDVQQWIVLLLASYSDAYASNQFRALQQFFRWLAEEEQVADPMAGLRAPQVREKLVPVFTSEELSALEKTCQGRSFAQRRDAAIIAVLTATGSAPPSWLGSVTTSIRGAAIWTCGGGRSRCGARAAGRGWSASATRPPAPSTATSGSAPGTRRRGGRSYGWG